MPSLASSVWQVEDESALSQHIRVIAKAYRFCTSGMWRWCPDCERKSLDVRWDA